jgi:transcriptional regulator with XRE-family HTH domain
MTLSDYLRTKAMSQAAFAEMVKMPQATINRYVKGKRFPDKATIFKIEDATGGKVRPADWFKQDKPERAQGEAA